MADDKLLAALQDRKVLLEAYAASSAGVMRLALQQSKELQAFRGRKDLAPAILERLRGIRAPGDPVIVGAHLYALELTGARPDTARGVAFVLKGQGKKDPYLAAQLAGFTGRTLMRPERVRLARPEAPARNLKPEELDEVLKAVEREGGQP